MTGLVSDLFGLKYVPTFGEGCRQSRGEILSEPSLSLVNQCVTKLSVALDYISSHFEVPHVVIGLRLISHGRNANTTTRERLPFYLRRPKIF